MTPDLYWIDGPWTGRLAISARPRGGDWLLDEVAGWRSAGVTAIVSLLETDEEEQLSIADESAMVREAGLVHISFPIPDRGVPASRSEAEQLLGRLTAILEGGGAVAIHCRQGIGRSALIASALLVGAGLDARESIRRTASARGLPVPETSEQRSWVERLAADRLAAAK